MFSSNLVSLALVIIGLSGLLREWFDFHPPSQKELSGDAAILWAVQSHPHELLEGLRVANASHEVWQALKMPRRLYLTSPVLSSVVQSKQFIDKKNVWNALGHDWIMFDLFNFWSSVDKGDFQGASRFGEILSVSVESALTKGKQLDMCFLASSLAHIVFLARENGPEEYPVQWTAFAFLDFSTIESRWRRLAESIRANLELDSEHTRDLLQEIAADFHSEGQAIDAAIAELAKSLLKELDSK